MNKANRYFKTKSGEHKVYLRRNWSQTWLLWDNEINRFCEVQKPNYDNLKEIELAYLFKELEGR